MSQKLKKEHSEEILNVECLDYSSPSWTRSILATDQAVKCGQRQKYVSTLIPFFLFGQVKDISGATESWKSQVEDLKKYTSYQDAVGLDGELIEFEWTNCPRFSSLFFAMIQNDLETKNIEPEDFKDRIVSMSIFNDFVWKKNDENCVSNAEEVKKLRHEFHTKTIGRFWVQDRKKSDMAIQMIKKGGGIAPSTRRDSESNQLVILSSQVSVL